MTTARRTLISLDNTPYYHCVARCVRRAFLCGDDRYTGKNFNHRRQWLVDRLQLQATMFAIDLCAYSIMSNHYHVVLRIDAERAAAWTDEEVIARWCKLFHAPLLVKAYRAGEALSEAERATVDTIIAVWRSRLHDISWFMRCLNEYIARKANQEDHCNGRFWEGRFKSQALLDEKALLACMAYVDLNPVRAGIAADLENSDFTSIQQRLRSIDDARPRAKRQIPGQPRPDTALLPFAEAGHTNRPGTLLPFTFKNYIDLVDWTGRLVRDEKRGAIQLQAPTALETIGLNHKQWLALSLNIQRATLQAIGNLDAVQKYSHSCGKKWMPGQRQLARIYSDSG